MQHRRLDGTDDGTAVRNALVIVVDDDAAVRHSLKFSLEVEGFTVRLYKRGDEVLNAPDVGACACLVIDQNMPGLSGLETVHKLRERSVRVPAILITGQPTPVLRARAGRVGANIVEKPMCGDALVEGIRDVIRH